MAFWRRGPLKGKRRPGRRMRRKRASLSTVLSRLPELQTIDQVTTGQQISSAIVTTLLFVPQRNNTNYTDRVGDQTVIKSILIEGTFARGTLQVTLGQHVRLLLFWDKQPNGAFPGGNLPLINPTPVGLMDPQYSKRFRCLWDKSFCIGGTGSEMSPSSEEMHFKYYKKCNLVTRFIGNAGNIADIETGALFMYLIGDTAITNNNVPTVSWTCRCRFTL